MKSLCARACVLSCTHLHVCVCVLVCAVRNVSCLRFFHLPPSSLSSLSGLVTANIHLNIRLPCWRDGTEVGWNDRKVSFHPHTRVVSSAPPLTMYLSFPLRHTLKTDPSCPTKGCTSCLLVLSLQTCLQCTFRCSYSHPAPQGCAPPMPAPPSLTPAPTRPLTSDNDVNGGVGAGAAASDAH